MRLSVQTVSILKETIKQYIKNPTVILFGSRVYDDKKGGDIDILVKTKEHVSLQTQIEILARCEIKGIDRKIDMVFENPWTKHQAIFQTANKEGIEL